MRHRHRALGGEPQSTPRLLLHRARDERCRWIPQLFTLPHIRDCIGRLAEILHNCIRIGPVRQLDLLTVSLDKTDRELLTWGLAPGGRLGLLHLLAQACLHGPVLDRHERLDLPFTINDQAHRNRLHPPRGQTLANLVPQQRAQLVSHKPVNHPAPLLRLHEIEIDLAGMLQRILHRRLRDLMEDHPSRQDRWLALRLHRLQQVPRNRLTFPVRVSRQQQLRSTTGKKRQLLDQVLLLLRHHVTRREFLVNVHPKPALGQIADMAE